jgi:NAD(P)-dependent dehydrogenase (short-subunit alcohol dehydrogenase family)
MGSRGFRPEALAGQHWQVEDNCFKPYPCGFVLHPALQACQALLNAHGVLDAAAVSRIQLHVAPLALMRADRPQPADGMSYKLSLQHALAAMLGTGDASVQRFTDAALMHPATQALVLVNSAGAAKRTPAPDLTPQSWHDAMQSKFFSYVHMMDPTIKAMAARGQGAIVNVVGNGGKVASPMHLPGGSANAALLLASAGLATAYAKQGIRVNAVSPGPTLTERLDTGITNDARLANISKETALARMVERIPMGRIASPEEVADAVVFLASSRASYITGVNIMMDGSLVPLI